MNANADAAGAPTGAEQPAGAGRHICCTMTNVLLGVMRDSGGEAAVGELLARAHSSRGASYLEDLENWISLDEACALLDAAAEQSGDELIARRVGERTLWRHLGTQTATLLRSLGSVEAVLAAVAPAASRFSTVTDLQATESQAGHAEIRAVARAGFDRRPQLCEWTKGMLSGVPILFSLSPARVLERECQATGASACVYEVTWDPEQAAAAADPQQRVTMLEAQLASTAERLHGAYATASDLVSSEDLDTVLRRIVERAASAVRAPGYVLAVRAQDSAELQVFSHGLEEQEAQRLARAAPDERDGGSTLVVEVTSSRRHYGQLIARFPGTAQFFDQDRELLGLYAKHAAAVLDMATALQESARRHEQVSALLALSQALAKVGTTEEVAQRLVAAVAEVIDCDRTGVWLWDPLERCLTCLAAWGRTPAQHDFLSTHAITPEDTPYLSQMIAMRQPQFFEAQTEDPAIRQWMGTLGNVAATVVPIVARDVLVGILTVGVAERPERLRPEPELLARITGIAALAAPAIQNGQLVDALRHKASHDGLTGLLNRAGFRHRIDRVLACARPGEGRVGLLFIDLDDFKAVNDAYGHDAGDEVLRKAARRLRAAAREQDEVARLGGDEFALVLTGIARDDQVRAAEARVRQLFADPFELGEIAVQLGVSVGGGVWPEHGRSVSELLRHADAAMYRDKSRSAQAPAAA